MGDDFNMSAFYQLLLIMLALTGQVAPREYKGLVDVREFIPNIVVEQRYATTNNFTGSAIYPENALCLLEKSTAIKLKKAEAEFENLGYHIKVWDAYRPVSAQWALYNATPDSLKAYAPAPSKSSQHPKGIAVDITLVDINGNELPMPTGFDDFSERAHIDYPEPGQIKKENRDLLISTMKKCGFSVSNIEWWHFYNPDKTNLDLSDVGI